MNNHKELHFRFVAFSEVHPRGKVIDTNRGFLNVAKVSILFCCDDCNWKKWVDIDVDTLMKKGIPKVIPPEKCEVDEE